MAKAFNYGGQAVVEGVMMRGRRAAAVAVRRTSGEIVVLEEALASKLYTHRIAQLPFMRGLVLLWDMLILGTRMMMFAASVSMEEPAEGATAAQDTARADEKPAVVEASAAEVAQARGAGIGLTLLISLAFAIALFFLLPLGIVGLARPLLGGGWLSLLAEGLIRLALLVAYLAAVGRLQGISRVFEYHGAEHKTINTYEAGLPLDVEHVCQASRVHTRCGTGFLLIVVIVSIIVFAFVGAPSLPVRILSRIVLVPFIASIAYELMRLGAAYYRHRVVRWLMAPSLALQGLTTREPDDRQIECAIVALERVLRRDGAPDLVRVA
jgi:uncharacterized protein YqhQ